MSEIRRAGAWYARRYGQCHYGDTYDALFPLCVATSAGFCTRRTPSEGMGWIENSPYCITCDSPTELSLNGCESRTLIRRLRKGLRDPRFGRRFSAAEGLRSQMETREMKRPA